MAHGSDKSSAEPRDREVPSEPAPHGAPKILDGKKSPKLYLWSAAAFLALVVLLVVISTNKQRSVAVESASRASDADAGPFVLTAKASRSSPDQTVSVLGETRPYAAVTLYAKISGYLGSISVDKGDHVKKGQVLARIFSPETTQEFGAAQADSRNKASIAQRVKDLHQRKLVSDQEFDQAKADADQAMARLESASAVKEYEVIRAPFDGTVTARYADPGALMQSAANSQASALPIVNVAQTERLRVTVYLDQRDAAHVRVGDKAEITLPEQPGLKFEALVSRQAGELDPRSRTLLTEIELDNRKGEIVAGGFVDVALKIKAPTYVQVPAEGLIMQKGKAFVAVVTTAKKIHFQPIEIGANDGENIDVLAGLGGDETIALSLGNNLAEGQQVQISNDGAGK